MNKPVFNLRVGPSLGVRKLPTVASGTTLGASLAAASTPSAAPPSTAPAARPTGPAGGPRIASMPSRPAIQPQAAALAPATAAQVLTTVDALPPSDLPSAADPVVVTASASGGVVSVQVTMSIPLGGADKPIARQALVAKLSAALSEFAAEVAEPAAEIVVPDTTFADVAEQELGLWSGEPTTLEQLAVPKAHVVAQPYVMADFPDDPFGEL